jgi:hypothetical protein
MNSLKSVCSFAKSAPIPFDQFQQHVESLLRSQIRVELIVGAIRVFKTVKHLKDSLHG